RPQRAPRNMCRYVCVVTHSENVASAPQRVLNAEQKSGALYTTKPIKTPTVVRAALAKSNLNLVLSSRPVNITITCKIIVELTTTADLIHGYIN
ncbi:hypothetical protein, partial [Atlantibacter hermannii]